MMSGDLEVLMMRPLRVPNWRTGQRDINLPAILRHAHGFEVFDRLATPNTLEDLLLLSGALLRDDAGDGLADHLRLPVPEDPLRGRVPGGDDSLEGLADDRVV